MSISSQAAATTASREILFALLPVEMWTVVLEHAFHQAILGNQPHNELIILFNSLFGIFGSLIRPALGALKPKLLVRIQEVDRLHNQLLFQQLVQQDNLNAAIAQNVLVSEAQEELHKASVLYADAGATLADLHACGGAIDTMLGYYYPDEPLEVYDYTDSEEQSDASMGDSS